MADAYTGKKPLDEMTTTERHFETDPRVSGIRAAQTQHYQNLRNVMTGAIASLKRAMENRDKNQPGRTHYELKFKDMAQSIRAYTEATGETVQAPPYYAPVGIAETCRTYSAKDFPRPVEAPPARNTKSTIVPNFANPESDEHQAWLTVQGVAPIDTQGLSPDSVATARKRRAGVPK